MRGGCSGRSGVGGVGGGSRKGGKEGWCGRVQYLGSSILDVESRGSTAG